MRTFPGCPGTNVFFVFCCFLFLGGRGEGRVHKGKVLVFVYCFFWDRVWLFHTGWSAGVCSQLTAALDSWAQMILLPWLPKVLGLQPRATTPSQGQRFHKGKARIFLTTATKRLIWRCSLSEILQMMCSVTQWNQQNKPGCRVLVWKEGGWAL